MGVAARGFVGVENNTTTDIWVPLHPQGDELLVPGHGPERGAQGGKQSLGQVGGRQADDVR